MSGRVDLSIMPCVDPGSLRNSASSARVAEPVAAIRLHGPRPPPRGRCKRAAASPPLLDQPQRRSLTLHNSSCIRAFIKDGPGMTFGWRASSAMRSCLAKRIRWDARIRNRAVKAALTALLVLAAQIHGAVLAWLLGCHANALDAKTRTPPMPTPVPVPIQNVHCQIRRRFSLTCARSAKCALSSDRGNVAATARNNACAKRGDRAAHA
jgi:hypothetical protein